eukprot:3233913-Prymnesium_polylepis.1
MSGESVFDDIGALLPLAVNLDVHPLLGVIPLQVRDMAARTRAWQRWCSARACAVGRMLEGASVRRAIKRLPNSGTTGTSLSRCPLGGTVENR